MPSKSPLALWHLLSLDAPTIAVLWTWFIADASHVRLPITSIVAMATAVWTLYAADRLLDTQSATPSDLEARHHFHHRYRTIFLAGILLASLALAVLLPRIPSEAIHLYLILGGLVFGYFILIHVPLNHSPDTKATPRLPKEIAVGICFAAAVFIPTVARRPDLRTTLVPSALLFAALCSLNCLFIYAWEHDPPDPIAHPVHPLTRLALNHLRAIGITIAVTGTALALLDHRTPWPVPFANALAAILLLLLHHRRHRITPLHLRAAADLALATPILLLPFLK
ncbi:MAG TPA: hypothetical protein VIX90_17490 [Edaphobacter sp.]